MPATQQKIITSQHIRTAVELIKLAEQQLELALAEGAFDRKTVIAIERNLQDLTITRSLVQDVAA